MASSSKESLTRVGDSALTGAGAGAPGVLSCAGGGGVVLLGAGATCCSLGAGAPPVGPQLWNTTVTQRLPCMTPAAHGRGRSWGTAQSALFAVAVELYLG